MQIRCTHCTKTVAIAASGELPLRCPHCAKSPGPEALGPYDPVRLIATGGMGEVWLARHRELGTEVALKLLPAMPLDALAGVRERFAREARLTARVRHPGVVKIHGNDVAADRPYLVLEFVAGRTLRERLGAGPLPIAEAARIAAAAADVLAAAHAEGVLHRDVKPDNVMVEPDGSVRVLDFGIARAVHDDAPLTRTGEIVGTPEYMAPEQLLDGPESTTERTDVHALGVLLFELLTGRSPFHGANVFQALKLVESLVPPPPSSLRPGVPAALDAVVQSALQKDPADRCSSARAFERAIVAATPEAAIAPRAPRTRWRPLLGASLAGALVAAIALVVVVRAIFPPVVTTTVERDEVTTAANAPKRRAEMRQLLAEGRWWRALQDARAAVAAGDPLALPIAQDAFLLSHHAWPLAVGAPQWLARCDEHERRALFGNTDDASDGPAVTPRSLLARGDAVAAVRALREGAPAGVPFDRDTRRLLALAAAVAGEPISTPDPDDASDRLLRTGAFEQFAARSPIDEPEHWLALRCAAASGSDEAKVAAQNAWSYGAGETIVLLDAFLWTAPDGVHHRGSLQRPTTAAALRRRLAIADPADAPASALFVGMLDALDDATGDLAALRFLPLPVRRDAARWFTIAADATPMRRDALVRLAAALDAEAARGR